MKKFATILVGFMALTPSAQAQLIINEVMQSNIDCLVDDINDFPDSWVELYNPGNTVEAINDYQLGLTNDASKAFTLPSTSLYPGDYLVIYCDKVNQVFHTDFRLESGKGGSIYLFKKGTVVDKIEKMKKQPAPNIAYGRKTDGSDTWGYMETPTPKAANCGKICKEILADPIFSKQGCILEKSQAFSLTLTIPKDAPAGTVIRYTTDGTEPTRQSTLYQDPIDISSTKLIRAKLFCDGYLSPRSKTASYIFHNRKMTLPVISIVGDNKYFYDDKFGILVDGTYSSWGAKNYEYDFRRPINFEYFAAPESNSKLNQLCETRVMGGATRSNPLKSMAVYANKRFGEKRLKYEFFPDQRPGVTAYKSIGLRNAGNDFAYLYMRDAIIQRAMAQNVDLDWQAWSPAIIYINGVYKGILNIRERSNEDNIFTNYDELEDIDMVENVYTLKTGDWDNFKKFQSFYSEKGHTMAEYEKWMDCGEYINLMAMNLFFNNLDFPGNNNVAWRPKAEGGKWRWIAKDTDFGLGLYGTPASYKTFEWLYNPNYDSNNTWGNREEYTLQFRRMMEDKDFKREFLDHTAIYMGDFLTEKNILQLWNSMYERIQAEYPFHYQLYGYWWFSYNTELSNAQKWLKERIPNFYQQMADFYKVGSPVPMTINAASSEQEGDMSITFNGITLSKPSFNGKFFKDREITLEGKAKDNSKEVTGWEITSYQGDISTKTHVDGNLCTLTMPDCTKLEIQAVLGDASGINSVNAETATWSCHRNGESLVLKQLSLGTPISIYSLQGSLVFQGSATSSEMTIPVGVGVRIVKAGGKVVKL